MMETPTPFLKCSYPDCVTFPESLKEKCRKCSTGFLHHLCQTAYESIHCAPCIDLGLRKKCYSCLLKVIEEEKKRLDLPVGVGDAWSIIPTETTIPDESIPLMPPLLTQPDRKKSRGSIPTNVAPIKINFKPPGEIETITRPQRENLLAQKGFKGNSSIFCVKIIYYGKAHGSDIPVD